jgi:beta-lactamase class A
MTTSRSLFEASLIYYQYTLGENRRKISCMSISKMSFESKGDKIALKVVALVLLAVIIVQFAWPSSKPLPYTKANGRTRFNLNPSNLNTEYSSRLDKTLAISVHDKKFAYKLKDLGVTYDEKKSIDPLLIKSWRQKLIPFYPLYLALQNHVPIYGTETQSLRFTLSAISEIINENPNNAELLVGDETISVKPSTNGVKFDIKPQLAAITGALERGANSVNLGTTTTIPDITTEELQKAVDATLVKLSSSIAVVLPTGTEVLDKKTLLSWLKLDIKDSTPTISVDSVKVNEFSDSLDAKYQSSNKSTPTVIVLVNGVETSRQQGIDGQGIDAGDLTSQLNTALNTKLPTITAKIIPIASPVFYSRGYTPGRAGLSEYIKDQAASKNSRIYYKDIASNFSVGAREHEPSYMASTYKLFAAYSVLKRIDEGSIKLSDTVNDQSYSSCLSVMIINSDNDCAIAMVERIGWTKVANEALALGAKEINWNEELTGSAFDASIIPTALYKKQILSPPSRDFLLGLMKQQKFRSGIPAGSAYEVADKVGFFEGWLNDTAVVYAGNRPYVLSIYTYKESWALISEITSQIEALSRY